MEEIELAVAESVVHGAARGLGGTVGHPHEMKDGKMLGIGSGDAGEGAEFSDTIRCAQGADSIDASVSVGGVGGVELVTAADPANVLVEADGIVYGKRIVAGHSEDIADADIVQALQNVLNYGHDLNLLLQF
jgi:hypothetical protein